MTTPSEGSESSGAATAPRPAHPSCWRRAFGAALLWWALLYVGLGVAVDFSSAEARGVAMGRLLVPLLIGAGVSGAIAQRSSTTWGWPKHLAVTFATGLVVQVLVGLS